MNTDRAIASPLSTTTKQPWYREPWPWLLLSGPAIVIVAGLYTAWLAVTSSDGLVTEDYYKKGLAAGETLARSRKAEELGVGAALRLAQDEIRLRLSMKAAGSPLPSALRVTISHPTRAGLDQQAELKPAGDAYIGTLHLPAAGHWLVLVEDADRTWRIMGSVMLPAAKETVIGEAPQPSSAQQ